MWWTGGRAGSLPNLVDQHSRHQLAALAPSQHCSHPNRESSGRKQSRECDSVFQGVWSLDQGESQHTRHYLECHVCRSLLMFAEEQQGSQDRTTENNCWACAETVHTNSMHEKSGKILQRSICMMQTCEKSCQRVFMCKRYSMSVDQSHSESW